MRTVLAALAWLSLGAAHAWAGYAYSNNGMSWRAWDQPSNLAVGEVYFSTVPTTAQLEAAFPGYSTAAAAASAQAMLATDLAQGITITAGGANSAPTGTFALDPTTQQQLAGIASTVALLGTFPGGTSSYAYPDITGAPKTFPSVSAFKSFYAAYTTLLQSMNTTEATLAAGGSASWPSQSVALQ